ncbi:MAG: HAMP domain-containing histidine kinase [Halobacteriovoraceae bacterium]|nr:HAMP domain-containing histidine kinase [Halobacteriovoraceae bacterium]
MENHYYTQYKKERDFSQRKNLIFILRLGIVTPLILVTVYKLFSLPLSNTLIYPCLFILIAAGFSSLLIRFEVENKKVATFMAFATFLIFHLLGWFLKSPGLHIWIIVANFLFSLLVSFRFLLYMCTLSIVNQAFLLIPPLINIENLSVAEFLGSGFIEQKLAIHFLIGNLVSCSFVLIAKNELRAFVKKIIDQAQELDQKNRLASMSELASKISHEVGHYLYHIGLHSERIENQIHIFKETGDEEAQEKILQSSKKIQASIDLLGRMINSLKNLSKEGDLKDLGAFDLRHLINELIYILKEHPLAQNVEFNFLPPQSEIIVFGNAILLNQVFFNLFQNSLNAICELEHKWINVSIIDREDNYFIEVTDSGQGVNKKIRPYLFTQFKSHSNNKSCTGLGLHICRDIIETHQGEIEYVDNMKHTTFMIRLPKFELAIENIEDMTPKRHSTEIVSEL